MYPLQHVNILAAPFTGPTREEGQKYASLAYPPKSEISVIPIVSGGMDSVTLLFSLLANEFHVPAVVSFNYGQRHAQQELSCIEYICDELYILQRTVDIRALQNVLGGSALTSEDIEVPDAMYTDESAAITVVPNRNAIMLNIAAGYVEYLISSNKDKAVISQPVLATAIHAGDHTIYKDCRPQFARALEASLVNSTDHSIGLWTPFVNITKAEILSIGLSYGVPYEHTYSCYKGAKDHCGSCPTCIERIESFTMNGVVDPVKYNPKGYAKGLELLKEEGRCF